MSEQTLPTNFTNYEIVEGRRRAAVAGHDEPDLASVQGENRCRSTEPICSSVEVKADGVAYPANA